MIKIGEPEILLKKDKAILQAKVFIQKHASIKYKNITKTLNNSAWRTDTDYPPKAWKNEETLVKFEVDRKYASLVIGNYNLIESLASEYMYQNISGMNNFVIKFKI